MSNLKSLIESDKSAQEIIEEGKVDKSVVGKTVTLIKMDDKQAPPKGTKGVVKLVDDIGQLHVKWSTGSTLALIPGEDKYIISEATFKPMKKAADVISAVDDLLTELYDSYPDFSKAQKEITTAIVGIENSIKQIKKDLK
jgi:DNA-directed RNA polymerase beta' subunit